MTRIPTIALALSALLVAGSAVAQTTPPPPTQTPKPPATTPQATPKPTPTPTLKPPTEPFPAGAMIAYVDLQIVVGQSKLGQAGHDQMLALNDKLAAALTVKNKEIQALQEKIKAQQNLVTDAVLQGMARELDKMQRDAQYMGQDSQVQINQLNEQLLQNFQNKVLPVVEEIRKEKGLWIIFGIGGENSNVLAAHVGLDLTFEVVKRLDATIK